MPRGFDVREGRGNLPLPAGSRWVRAFPAAATTTVVEESLGASPSTRPAGTWHRPAARGDRRTTLPSLAAHPRCSRSCPTASEPQQIWGDKSPGKASCAFPQRGWAVSSWVFFWGCVAILPHFVSDPQPPRHPGASASRRLGSLPAAFLRADVAFLSSPILITLEFMNHISPKL